MAGILQNVFSKGIYTLKDPENVSKIKTLVNHSALYFGLIVYTAIGAKVFQLLELPAELEEKETFKALLETDRRLFLDRVTNISLMRAEVGDAQFSTIINSALVNYETSCSEAGNVGIDIVKKVDKKRNLISIKHKFYRNLVLIGTLYSLASSVSLFSQP